MNNLIKTSFNGDGNLGLYGFATDKYCFLGANHKKIRQALGVPVYTATLFNMDMAGLFTAGNSHGIVIPEVVAEYDMPKLRKYFDNILVLDTRYTALGNLIMMNDKGIVVSPLIKKHRKQIGEFFGVECVSTPIAKNKIVGNLGIATNKGCLLHPKVRKSEVKIIEEVLHVSSDIGTVSFGSPFPGAGIIANSNGFAAAEDTSGPELGRIVEALGFL